MFIIALFGLIAWSAAGMVLMQAIWEKRDPDAAPTAREVACLLAAGPVVWALGIAAFAGYTLSCIADWAAAGADEQKDGEGQAVKRTVPNMPRPAPPPPKLPDASGALRLAMEYLECTDGWRGMLAGCAVAPETWDAWERIIRTVGRNLTGIETTGETR